MLTIVFAFVVATCLFLAFSQTRALGVVGVFILLAINPLLGLVLLLAAFIWNRWMRYDPQQPTFLSKDTKKSALLPLLALPWLGDSVPTAEAPTTEPAASQQSPQTDEPEARGGDDSSPPS